MKRKMLGLLIAAILAMGVFTGCQSSVEEPVDAAETADSIRVYYKNEDGTASMSAGYELTSEGDAAIREIFEVLQNGQFGDGRTAVPSDVRLVRSAWQEHSLVLYLEGGYPKVGTLEEILCRYAIVQTMFQLVDVEGVTIHVNNQPLTNREGMEIGTMTLKSFLGDVAASSMQTEAKKVNLYYTNADSTVLKRCHAEIMENATISMEKQIVEKIIAGPTEPGLYATIPSSTKLLSISTHNRICYVNLNSDFLDELLPVANTIRVYSLINSLTELEEVDSVQLMINGTADFEISPDISPAGPLSPDMTLVE